MDNGVLNDGDKKATKKKLTPDERIARLTARIEQLKQQKQAISNREKNMQRRQRTRRLIENGALAEKYLSAEGASPADFEALLKQLIDMPQVKSLLRRIDGRQ